MTQPETKTVLGRVFTRTELVADGWECNTSTGWLTLDRHEALVTASLHNRDGEEVASGDGPTESDAILALQSTLRKMAELVGGK